MELTSQGWALAARPTAMPTHEHFTQVTESIAVPGEGQIQVKNTYLSVDPYMRGRMRDTPSYVPPFRLGEVMQGGAVGNVTASAHPDYKAGDKVQSMAGWRQAWVGNPESFMTQRIDPNVGLPEQAYLGVAGMPGITAYAGILSVASLEQGDTVFVSAAAGAVGSTVVQIAKLKGCTVIASAGGTEKCAFVKSLGADAVIDYKAHKDYPALLAALQEAAPKGINVYFDNVGGDHLTAALECATRFARFAICGMISQYNREGAMQAPHNLLYIIGKELQIRGFIVSSHLDIIPQFLQDMGHWIKVGDLTYKETISDGINTMPDAFIGLFKGANLGKMLVRA